MASAGPSPGIMGAGEPALPLPRCTELALDVGIASELALPLICCMVAWKRESPSSLLSYGNYGKQKIWPVVMRVGDLALPLTR